MQDTGGWLSELWITAMAEVKVVSAESVSETRRHLLSERGVSDVLHVELAG